VDAAPNEQHSYFTYVIRIPKRDRSAKVLYDHGIYTTLRYHPLHMNAIYRSDARLPNSERLNEEALSIPLHPNLSAGDIERSSRRSAPPVLVNAVPLRSKKNPKIPPRI
jgi:aminotransferase